MTDIDWAAYWNVWRAELLLSTIAPAILAVGAAILFGTDAISEWWLRRQKRKWERRAGE